MCFFAIFLKWLLSASSCACAPSEKPTCDSSGDRSVSMSTQPSTIGVLDHLLSDLAVAMGPDRARAEPLLLALYARDAGVQAGAAAAVCFPRHVDDVVAAVRAARRHGVPFVARGSGTGLAGG